MARTATRRSATRTYPVPALEKGLDILELLVHESDGLGMSEIARRLNRTVSEIFRMLLCLEQRGYIAQKIGDERYHLTLKLFHLAQEHPPARRMLTQALPIMQAAARQMSQSCHLAVLEAGQIVIIAQVDSPLPVGFHVRTGSTADILHTTSGHVLLAFQTHEIRDRILEEWAERSGKSLPARFEQHLATIRKNGYEEHESYAVKGVLNISMPVLDHWGTAIAALTIPYIRHADSELTQAMVREQLRKAALQLTQLIGGETKP